MVQHWVYCGYSYSVWNCKYRSMGKLVVLSCWGVAWVVFVVFSLSRCRFVAVYTGMEYNKYGQFVVWHWVYCGYSYAVCNCKYSSVVKLVVLQCWDVAWAVHPVLSITAFFINGARIYQEPVSSNYWKYLLRSGLLATCCGWYERFAHYFTCPIS